MWWLHLGGWPHSLKIASLFALFAPLSLLDMLWWIRLLPEWLDQLPLHNKKMYPLLPVKIPYPLYWGVETRLHLLHTSPLRLWLILRLEWVIVLESCEIFFYIHHHKHVHFAFVVFPNLYPAPGTVCLSNHGIFCSAPLGLILGDLRVVFRNIVIQNHQCIARSLSGTIIASKIPGQYHSVYTLSCSNFYLAVAALWYLRTGDYTSHA